MKIVWFTENYPPNKGGMARSCDRIVKELRKHYQVHILHFTNKVKAFDKEEQVGGTYTALPIYEDMAFTLNVTWSFVERNELIKNSDYFVSYGSNLCLKGIALMSQWLNKPLVSCFRGNDFDNAIFSQRRQDVLYAIKHSDAIACVTKEKVERIKKLDLNNNVYFTHNSIDISEWEVNDSDRALAKNIRKEINLQNKQVIGLIGYLKQKKGISFLIKSIEHSSLKQKLHFRIVGDLETHLQWMIQRAKISYSIVTPDTKTALIANYLACDAIMVPSIYDGMPNVILEAAALQIPIIASNAGGIKDVLTNEDAFIFEVLSSYELLNQLNLFRKASKSELHQKITRLFTKVKEQYTPAKEISEYIRIFSQLETKKNNHICE